jgi:WD40 repeat protein
LLEPVTAASLSPDGTRVLTSSLDGTVRMYRCEICSGLDGLLELAKRRLAGFAR